MLLWLVFATKQLVIELEKYSPEFVQLNGTPVQDMTLSNTVNEEFRNHLTNTNKNLNGVDLSVR